MAGVLMSSASQTIPAGPPRLRQIKSRPLRNQIDLVRELVSRDLKVRYKRSALGFGWSLLNPLIQLVVFGIVFSRLIPVKVPDFSLFLFSGILIWSWFQGSLYNATTCIVDNPGLLRQPRFPSAMLPLAAIATNWLHFVFALPILLIAALVAGHSAAGLWTLPVIMFVQFLFTLAVCYVTASVHVRFRDTQHILGVLLFVGFYLVPVFYLTESVPADLRSWYQMNPLVQIFDAYHAAVLGGTAPNWEALARTAVESVALLAISVLIFIRSSRSFVEEL